MSTATKSRNPSKAAELPELPVGSKLNPDTAIRVPKGAIVRTNDPNRPEGSYVTTRPQMVEAEIVDLGKLGTVARWKARGGHYVGETATFDTLVDNAAAAKLEAVVVRLEKVRELHQPRRKSGDGFTNQWCRECKQDWPCPTFDAAGGTVPEADQL